MGTRLARRVRRWRWKLAGARALRACGWAWLALAGAIGAVVLVLRAHFDLEVGPWAWIFAAAGGIAAAIGWRAAREVPSEEALVAWLEARSRSGGALLA